ncbi:iron ABC transporter permease [Roseivivax sp. GX 12232]|uniref:FecCD family ABC transporter permease n=1 Tax=Roseivivax sp. GX 12232 TaxID=2900547 RepID=UPI001E4BA855|nr:iron ABC transporter permease [Roseivivax sp. GX 12232]MCE0505901.1 iron ABC transporter permease [Roseivivax sp. GX 12232]
MISSRADASASRLAPVLAVALVAAMVASLHLGLRLYGPGTVWSGLRGAGDTDALIVSTLRVPRTLIGACCGGLLGLSGLLMQAATRNPLAEPGLLGINAGAALAVVSALVLFGVAAPGGMALAAFAGAMLAMVLVFGLSSLGGTGMNPVSVLLAGVTLAAMTSAVTQVLLLTDEAAMESLLFWLSGGFADRDIGLLWLGAPMLVAGLGGALWLASALDALRADDDSAAALGVEVLRTRVLALGLAGLLAGTVVALAGPVIFLGLVAPHIARRLAGRSTHAALAVLTMLIGATLAVLADILARLIVAPGEAPIGTVLALAGVPVLIAVLRRGTGAAP